MHRTLCLGLSLLPLVAALLLTQSLLAQTQGAAPAVDREAMWPAPSAEDWKLPCLIQWQRSWEDAAALSQETQKAILVCVNMDGEIASEHYAGVRYRQPDIAALYQPYVCVIASVYRHTPRDHDEEGGRIPCPRFGTVTCGEHIEIEPYLFERFMDGRRIAPRHIGVELDSAEIYDVFYAWDTDTIFNSLRKGIAERPAPPPDLRGDRPALELVGSRDSLEQAEVEGAFVRGDKLVRKRLLERVLITPEVSPVDLLRLALSGFDPELQRLARKALAQSTDPRAADLINDALRVPMEPAEREALIAALVRLGESSPRAHALARVHQGLAARSTALDVERWSRALESAPPATYEPATPPSALLQARAEAAESRPADGPSKLALAEAFLASAEEPSTDRGFAPLLYSDARRAADEAVALGARGWRLDATLTRLALAEGRRDQAFEHAERALKELPTDAGDAGSLAVLTTFALGRQRAIARAVRHKQDWPGTWLTDVHATYSVIARHPLVDQDSFIDHYDFLRWFGAAAQAAQALEEGLKRFPESGVLHDRLRARLIAERKIEALESHYEAWLAREVPPPRNLAWFAGYASLVAAEFQRRAGQDEAALAAYDRGIAHFEANAVRHPEMRADSDHYVAVALGARARVHYEHGQDEQAVSALEACFARRQDAANALDGLNLSAVDTAKMLLDRLKRAERTVLAERLDRALSKLPAELLRLPAYEREVPPTRGDRPQPPPQERRGG